ncbi:MAG: ROK family protein [Solirubrobacterales bacterium]
MLRRKVDQPEDQAAETGAAEAADAAGTAPEPEPVPESAVSGSESASSESASNEPEPAQPEPGSATPEVAAAGTEPGSAPAEVEPAGVLEEDVRDEQIEVTPGPVASHSPEPQTPAEQLTARQQSVHQAPEPDSKDFMKDRREASKAQRKADKEKRKADRKAAKEARKARRQSVGQSEAMALDPLAPTTPGPVAPPRPPNPPVGSPAAGIATAAAEAKAEEIAPVRPDVDLPPITPPGVKPVRTGRRSAGLIGGIDLGGTKIAAAVLDADHKVIAYRRRPTPDRGGPADVVRAMAVTMQEAALDAGTEAHRLLAVGVGSPGSVDPDSGAVSGAGNLPDWDGTFQLRLALQEELGTEVRVGNDVQVGTRGEYELGAGAGYSSLLGVFWGTGVGGGIIINGEPWLGRGRAGEIGHTLVRRGGAKGLNGLNGTVEAYAGRAAMEEKARREVKKGRKTKLFKLMKKHEKTHLTSAIWQHALDQDDELAQDLLNRAVAALSAGIASAVNLLDPEAVVIGGGLGVRFADTLVPEIIAGMDQYLLNKDNPPAVKVAALGDEGGVIGASLLVKELVEANQAPTA